MYTQKQDALDCFSQIVSMRKAERWQQGYGTVASIAQKALHPDEEGVLRIAGVAWIAAVAYKFSCLATIRTIIGPRKDDLGKLAGVALDIEGELCDNNHVVDGPVVERLACKISVRYGPFSFLRESALY